MTILKTILFTIEALCSILLIGIILIQKGKGGGLGLAFGGGAGEALFGSRAGNVLTKGTVILAVIFMVNTVALAILFARTHDRALMDDEMRPVPTQPEQSLPAVPPVDEDAPRPSAEPPVEAEEAPAVAPERAPAGEPESVLDPAPAGGPEPERVPESPQE
jgi:preprotein translocase subunit SecG